MSSWVFPFDPAHVNPASEGLDPTMDKPGAKIKYGSKINFDLPRYQRR
jgi:hypothetical protein